MTPSKVDVIFYGGPGAGKTTQADLLTKSLKAVHINMGEALRAIGKSRSQLGNLIRAAVASGKLLDNKTISAVIEQEVGKVPAKTTLVFDGCPRNLAQAKNLDKYLATLGRKAVMIYLEVPVEVALERLQKRRRSDDVKPEVVRNRIRIFKNHSKKLLGYFKENDRLLVIDGDSEMKKINKLIIESIKKWR